MFVRTSRTFATMSWSICQLILVFILLNSSGVHADVVNASAINVTTAVGSTVTFSCRTTNSNERIRWQFRSPPSTIVTRIHNGFQLLDETNEKFADVLLEAKRESILILKRAGVNDTGTYTCLETNSSRYKIDFALRIVDNDPIDGGMPAAATSDVLTTDNAGQHHESQTTHAGVQPVAVDNSVQTIAISGVVGVLLFCTLIVVIHVVLLTKFRRSETAGTVRSESQQASNERRHKHRHQHSAPDAAAEPPAESISDTTASPNHSSSSQSSINHHYSEIMEPDTSVADTAVIGADIAPPTEYSTRVNVGQYQGLDPAAVTELSTRQPNAYINLVHLGGSARQNNPA